MAVLDPGQLTAIVDTREQYPLDLGQLPVETGTLTTGDYSLKGFESLISIERKALSDLIGCMTSGRERFENELQRLKAYPVRAIVIEATWQDLEQGNYRSKLNPLAACHTVASWVSQFCTPFQFVGSHEAAGRFVSYLLYSTAKKEHARLQALFPKGGINS